MNELTMNLKTDSGTPLYEQIYRYIRSEIRSGRIPCGERLPGAVQASGGEQEYGGACI